MKGTSFALTMAGLFALPLAAQENANSLFTASLGAGFTMPVYSAGSQLDTGWNAQAQAGVNFFGARLGLVGEFDFNDMGINSTTLSAVGFPGGNTYIYSFSGEPVIRFHPNSRFSPYLIGGPGVYHRDVDFTVPGVATGFGIDPFFGIYPVGISTNIVVQHYATTKLGVNGGLGFNYRLGSGHAKFFAEARYTQMYTQHTMAYIPVTFGFRW